MINGIMKPTVTATGAMVEHSNQAIEELLRQKEEAIKTTDAWQMYVGEDGSGDRERWYKYTHEGEDPSGEGLIEGIGNDIKFAMAKASYSFRNSVKEWMSEVLRVLFEAASLCIDTLRTFQLVVLSILGPLVFGLAVFDGFQHTLTVWLARYINIFCGCLWRTSLGASSAKFRKNAAGRHCTGQRIRRHFLQQDRHGLLGIYDHWDCRVFHSGLPLPITLSTPEVGVR
jgi:conjugative transposon TraJ protein